MSHNQPLPGTQPYTLEILRLVFPPNQIDHSCPHRHHHHYNPSHRFRHWHWFLHDLCYFQPLPKHLSFHIMDYNNNQRPNSTVKAIFPSLDDEYVCVQLLRIELLFKTTQPTKKDPWRYRYEYTQVGHLLLLIFHHKHCHITQKSQFSFVEWVEVNPHLMGNKYLRRGGASCSTPCDDRHACTPDLLY